MKPVTYIRCPQKRPMFERIVFHKACNLIVCCNCEWAYLLCRTQQFTLIALNVGYISCKFLLVVINEQINFSLPMEVFSSMHWVLS
jgi:hypothetical protein